MTLSEYTNKVSVLVVGLIKHIKNQGVSYQDSSLLVFVYSLMNNEIEKLNILRAYLLKIFQISYHY